MVKIPEVLKSSDGTGNISRTVTGIAGLIIVIGASYLPITEAEIAEIINQALIVGASIYTLYGLVIKVRNKIKK